MADDLELIDDTEQQVEEPEQQTDETEHAESDSTEETTESDAPAPTMLFEQGGKLSPAVKDALLKLKTEKPEVGKLLTKAVFRVAELDREFPGGLTEAREMRDKVDEFGGLSGIEEKMTELSQYSAVVDAFDAQNPAFVDELATFPESFCALAPAFIGKYAELSPDGFKSYIGKLVYGDMQTNEVPLLMMRLQDFIGDNPKAIEVFEKINGYLGGFRNMAAINPAAPRAATAKPAANADNNKREDELRSKEWKIERQSIERTTRDSELTRSLAGRRPSTEERAQINELFLSRSKAAADRYFPGWGEKAQRFIRNNDKAGYLRYMTSIYSRVVPEAMASAVSATMKSARRPAASANGQPAKPKPAGVAGAPAADGFKRMANMPPPYEIDYTRTSPSMISGNKAVLRDGKKVSWA